MIEMKYVVLKPDEKELIRFFLGANHDTAIKEQQ